MIYDHQVLRDERRKRHWKLKDVAQMLNTTPGTISNWENGRTKGSPSRIQPLLDLYGLKLRDVLTDNLIPKNLMPIINPHGFSSDYTTF